MQLNEIVHFWKDQCQDQSGRWMHKEDAPYFERYPHTFNLDYPVGPYVGDILNAPILILGANAGYSVTVTPDEFPDQDAIDRYLDRIKKPDTVWSGLSRYYYDKTNYGDLLERRRAVLVNACAYRSPKISEEKENKKLLEKLPSVKFTRQWLLRAVLPLAEKGEKLIIVKRPGLWKSLAHIEECENFVKDPAPANSRITSHAWQAVQARLATLDE